jgi:hypothetical protein
MYGRWVYDQGALRDAGFAAGPLDLVRSVRPAGIPRAASRVGLTEVPLDGRRAPECASADLTSTGRQLPRKRKPHEAADARGRIRGPLGDSTSCLRNTTLARAGARLSSFPRSGLGQSCCAGPAHLPALTCQHLRADRKQTQHRPPTLTWPARAWSCCGYCLSHWSRASCSEPTPAIGRSLHPISKGPRD